MTYGYALALQKSVRTVLLADTDLAALISTRLYDEPPENVVFPYARFGNITPGTDDTDGTENAVVSFVIETYSRFTGRVQASQIAEAVRARLHRNEAPVTSELASDGFRAIELICNNYFVDRDDAVGRGYTGRILFTAIMETA